MKIWNLLQSWISVSGLRCLLKVNHWYTQHCGLYQWLTLSKQRQPTPKENDSFAVVLWIRLPNGREDIPVVVRERHPSASYSIYQAGGLILATDTCFYNRFGEVRPGVI